LVFIIIANEVCPLIYGLSVLEKEPKHFTCQHVTESGETVWTDCKKAEICDKGLSHDQFQPDTSDDEYIYNWVDTLDLLCEPKYKVGLIGSMYFIGLCIAFTFVPLLGDQCGRKWVFILTLVISFFA
jgi:hypothetical protein